MFYFLFRFISKVFRSLNFRSLNDIYIPNKTPFLPGFLPATEGSARGNYGLMDQVAALHWVQENIAEFGGDFKNVTIVGQGHGAAFVNLLMISPMARGIINSIFPCFIIMRRRIC